MPGSPEQNSPYQGPVPQVNTDTCQCCKRCLGARVCPTGALHDTVPGQPPAIDAAACEGCMACVTACPVHGIDPPPEG